MVKAGGAGKGPQPGPSRGSEHHSGERSDDQPEVTDGDHVLLIGPRSAQPSSSSGGQDGSSRVGGGEGTAGGPEKLRSSLKWQGSLRERERETRTPEGWRLSHSSVSSVYYSAQDISELMSADNLSDWSSDQLSSFRSYHSVRDSLLNDRDSDDRDDDVFNSPQESPTCSGAPIQQQPTRKVVKSVVFVEAMASKDVDYVLVWDSKTEASKTEEAKDKRKFFERHLEEEGLVLEREKIEGTDYNFVKIHAPTEVLQRYAEILKLRMPMKQVHGDVVDSIYAANEEFQQFPHLNELKNRGSALISEVKSCLNMLTDYFRVDPRVFPTKDQKMTAVYTREKEYLFDVDEKEFFTPAVRARIVDFIMRRKRYTDNDHDDFAFGIERLLQASVYFAAYPLHDGDLKTPGSQRYLLYTEWGAIGKCLKYQPLDAVKEYFGVKIGLYFAWLGFYTHMLIPASILGVICFLYGVLTLADNQHSNDICNSSLDITMCPLCDKLCPYWKLNETCFYAELTYLFDNDATVVFAIIMSLWSAVFLESWKRYSAEITHRWDVTGFDINEEHPRPEYLIRLKHVKRKETNIITNVQEPYVPFWRMKLPYTVFSVSMVLFLCSLAFAAVVAVVIYRVSVVLALSKSKYSQAGVHSWGLIFVNTTAASINLVFIFFFNWLYSYLAEYLTELELHRTQTEFDDSVTLKMYLLQFVNYYASIFYIAFYKGKFVGYPSKYSRLFNTYRQEECAPGGCMSELCIQLATIMVGKQAMNTVMEMLWPILMKSYQKFTLMTGISKEDKSETFSAQWMKDAKLLEWGPRSLFPEYLEMVLQYGFITIFVAAFPLAPLFALLNNILEMRLDAKKLLVYYRRPVSQRVKDIGVWYTILDAISKIAVITNAFIIAFTSNFIPKLVYRYAPVFKSGPQRETYGTLDGFLNYTLATFSTADLDELSRPDPSANASDPGVCRYPTFRHSYDYHDETMKYKRTDFYWVVWMARFAFVVVFQNVVIICVLLLRWMIPDIPKKLQDQIRRETYLTNEIIIKQEMLRARGVTVGDSTAWNPISGEKELELVRFSSRGNSLRKRNTREDALDERNKQSAEVMV